MTPQLKIFEKGNKAVNDRIITCIRNRFDHKEDYYKQARGNIFWNNNYIECESNESKGDGNTIKTLSVEGYLN